MPVGGCVSVYLQRTDRFFLKLLLGRQGSYGRLCSRQQGFFLQWLESASAPSHTLSDPSGSVELSCCLPGVLFCLLQIEEKYSARPEIAQVGAFGDKERSSRDFKRVRTALRIRRTGHSLGGFVSLVYTNLSKFNSKGI